MAKKRGSKRKSEVKDVSEENNQEEVAANGDASASKKRKSGVKNGVPSETPASASKKKGAAKSETEEEDTTSNDSKKRKSGVKSEESTNGTASASKKKNNAKSESESEDDTDYEVLKIVDVRYTKSDKREFLIRWKNYSPKQNSWEPEENLSCDELIAKFLEDKEKKSKEPSKQLRKKPAAAKQFASPGNRRSKRTGGTRKNYIEAEDGDED